MDFSVIVLFLVCVANLLLGLFVLIRDPKSSVTRSFFSISVFISAWAVCNYLADNAGSLSLNTLFNRLAYPFGFLAITSTVVFSRNFTRKVDKRKLHPFSILLVIVISLFSLTNYVAGYVAEENGKLVFTVGAFIGVYIAAIIFLVATIARDFYFAIRSGTQIQKNQARIIMSWVKRIAIIRLRVSLWS